MRACASLDPSKDVKIGLVEETVKAKVDFILI